VAVAPQVVQNYFTLAHVDEDVVRLAKENAMFYQAYSLLKVPFFFLLWQLCE